jgi:hypothetical protein
MSTSYTANTTEHNQHNRPSQQQQKIRREERREDNNKKRTRAPDLVRTNKLKMGRPSTPGWFAADICSRIAANSCCCLYWVRIWTGTFGLPFFIVIMWWWFVVVWYKSASGRPVMRTVPPKDDTMLPVVHACVVGEVDASQHSSSRRLVAIERTSMVLQQTSIQFFDWKRRDAIHEPFDVDGYASANVRVTQARLSYGFVNNRATPVSLSLSLYIYIYISFTHSLYYS